MTLVAALAAAYLTLLIGKAALAARVARHEPALTPTTGAGVAVAQAVLSGDPRLAAVLGDNLRVLPQAHFLWLVDRDDPAGEATCLAVAAACPRVRVDVCVVAAAPERVNPKLWKLEVARARLDAPLLLVLDDDTRMPATTLSGLVASLETHDLATSLPDYAPGVGWPSRLLAQFVANNAAMTYLPLLPWRAPITINGMAYLLRRTTLEAIGGFAPLFAHLTDDLAVAGRVRAHGGRIFQSARTHLVETSVRDTRHYVQLMHRWNLFALLLLRTQASGDRALIAVLHGLPPLLLVAMVCATLATPRPEVLVTLAGVLIVRALALVGVGYAVGTPRRLDPVVSITSELLQPLHLLHAAVSRRITWRTRRYLVRSNRNFEAV